MPDHRLHRYEVLHNKLSGLEELPVDCNPVEIQSHNPLVELAVYRHPCHHRKTKELLQSEKEKTHAAEIMTEECQDKLRQAEQERDYALSHQKKVEIPVDKYFIGTICIYFRANMYYHISTKGECI